MIKLEQVVAVRGLDIQTTGGTRNMAGNLPVAPGDWVEVWNGVVMGWKRRQGRPIIRPSGAYYLFMELLQGAYTIVKRSTADLAEIERTEVMPPEADATCLFFTYNETKNVSVWQTATGGVLRVDDEDATFALDATDFFMADGYLTDEGDLVWVYCQLNISPTIQVAVFSFYTNASLERTVDLSSPIAAVFPDAVSLEDDWNAEVEAAVTWTVEPYESGYNDATYPDGVYPMEKVPVPADDESRPALEQTSQSLSLVQVCPWSPAVIVGTGASRAVIVGLLHPLGDDFRSIRVANSYVSRTFHINETTTSLLQEKKASWANLQYFYSGRANRYISEINGETVHTSRFFFDATLGSGEGLVETGDMVSDDYPITSVQRIAQKTVLAPEGYIDCVLEVPTDPPFTLGYAPWSYVLGYDEANFVFVDKEGWDGEIWMNLFDAAGVETDISTTSSADIKNSRVLKLSR